MFENRYFSPALFFHIVLMRKSLHHFKYSKPQVCSVCNNKQIENRKVCGACRTKQSRKQQQNSHDSTSEVQQNGMEIVMEVDEVNEGETPTFREAPRQHLSPSQLPPHLTFLNVEVSSLLEEHCKQLKERDIIIEEKDKTIQELKNKLNKLQKNQGVSKPVNNHQGLPKTTEGRRNRLKRADAKFMKLILSEKHPLGPKDFAVIIDRQFLAEIVKENGLENTIREEALEEVKKSLNRHSIVGLCDRGISTQVYSLLYHQGDLHEVLPPPYHIKLARVEENKQLQEFDPVFTFDGVEFDPKAVMATLLEIHPDVTVVLFAFDGHKLGKGMLASDSSMTGVYLIPKLKGQKLSRKHVFRLAMYEQKDTRFHLRRNTPRTRAWLDSIHKQAKADGKPGCAAVKKHDGTTKYITLLGGADMKSHWETAGGVWCFLCPCQRKNVGDLSNRYLPTFDPDEAPTNALFYIPRKNLRICTFHADKCLVTFLLNQSVRFWSTASSTIEKVESKEKFEDYLKENNFISSRMNLEVGVKSGRPKELKFRTADEARKFLNIAEGALAILDPRPEVQQFCSLLKNMITLTNNQDQTAETVKELQELESKLHNGFLDAYMAKKMTIYIHFYTAGHVTRMQEEGLKLGVPLALLQLQDMENAGGHDQHLYISSTQHGGGRKVKERPLLELPSEGRTCELDQSNDQSADELARWLQINGESIERRRATLNKLTVQQLQRILKLMGESKKGTKNELILHCMKVFKEEKEKRDQLKRIQHMDEHAFQSYCSHHPTIQILQIHSREIWRQKQEKRNV